MNNNNIIFEKMHVAPAALAVFDHDPQQAVDTRAVTCRHRLKLCLCICWFCLFVFVLTPFSREHFGPPPPRTEAAVGYDTM